MVSTAGYIPETTFFSVSEDVVVSLLAASEIKVTFLIPYLLQQFKLPVIAERWFGKMSSLMLELYSKAGWQESNCISSISGESQRSSNHHIHSHLHKGTEEHTSLTALSDSLTTTFQIHEYQCLIVQSSSIKY